ncbi:hypothetical protein [Endozoicomonas numazuensis]|uniref:hypothetical protein n=1 Tax=Endozoicomonas numazuensis TaxID=1137799 RepID=UPI000A704751|nr:hypothetical protein [Endozoicomonas numazuensis]
MSQKMLFTGCDSMKILCILLIVLCTASWADKNDSPSQDLARLFDSIPVDIEPYENSGYIERNYIGCLSHELEIYGVLSQDKRICIVLNENNTLSKTTKFSEIFPDSTSLSTTASHFITSNSTLNQSYWQMNNDSLCYIQERSGSQHSCLLPSNYFESNGAWIHGEPSPDSYSDEGCGDLQAAVVGTGLFVVITVSILTIINVVACQIRSSKYSGYSSL